MKSFKPRQFLLTLALALFACLMPVASWAAPPDMPPGLEKKLMDQANTQGHARVIVRMKIPGRPFELEGKLPDQAAKGQQRANIAKAAKALRGEMLPLQARVNREYVTLPYMAMSVNANALKHLLKSPRIISIEEDQVREALNASATPFVGADSTWAAGYGGKGASVAILDTGIDNDHPFFLGGGVDGDILRIVDEACFSSDNGESFRHSLCPTSDPEYGPGSADATVADCFNATGGNICTHGTHVAGIAAGQDDPLDVSNNYDGIAPEAGIVAVQVFHRVDDCNDDVGGDQPCVRTWDSDYNAGLDWVQWFALPRHNVVAANMSLGGGIHIDPCGGSSTQTAIAALRSAGAATAVASGNNGWTWAIGHPACAPDAVTVGAVTDWNFDVWYNMSKDVDITASGRSMDSSVPDDAYSNKSGTSMATPQVTGAFAVLKAIDPSMTIDEAEQLLKDTGFLVMDQRDANPVVGDDDYPNDTDQVCEGNEDQPECQPYTRVIKPMLQLDVAVAAITESDLEIYKDCKPDGDKLAGEEALCFITVSNYGDDAAMDVEVTDTYISDGSADYELGTPVLDPADAGSCTVSANPQNPSGKVTCDLGAMLAGEVVSITIPVNTDAPLNIDNNATVTALTPDPFLLNNGSTDGLVFYEDADLEVQKICKPDGDAVVGEEVGTCEIFITNHGPSVAVNATLVDEIFSDGNYEVSATDDDADATCTPSTPTDNADVECDLGDMDPGEVIKVTVLIDTEEEIDVNDIATATSDTLDSDTSNNSDQGQVSFVLPDADVVVTKQCQPITPAPTGSDAFCEIFVYNNGPSTAMNVQLDDQIASDGNYEVTAISASTGDCSPTGPNVDVQCDLYEILAGDTRTVVVTFTSNEQVDVDDIATATSDTYDPDPNNNSATGSVTFAGADLVVTKQCQPVTPAPAGSTAFCEIFVYNNGPSLAAGVMLNDQIASDGAYTVTLVEPVGAVSCSAGGDNVDVSCNLGDIAAGVTDSVKVTFTTNDEVDVDDIASATSDSYDPDPNNNTASGSVSFTGIADLSVTKSGNGPSVIAGTSLTYTIEVDNAGPSAAVNVVVSDFLPDQAEFVSFQFTEGEGECVAGEAGDPLQPTRCGMGSIPAGGGATVEIEVFIQPDALGTLHNDVTVSSDTYDDDNSDNQVTENTTIVVETSLSLTKIADKATVTAGGELKYLLQLSNGGPSTATDVILVDNLPLETHWMKTKVLGGMGDCLLSATDPDIVTCTLDDMGPGEEFLVVITVLVDPSVPHGTTITNNAVVTESSGPGDDASVDTLVEASADLWIDKTGGFLTNNPSKTIHYKLIVHNDTGCSGNDPQVCGEGGPSDAQDVYVVDRLPSTNKKLIVEFVSEDCIYDKPAHEVICTMDTPLAAGDSVFFEIEVNPRGTLRAIVNKADVFSSTDDPNPGNNYDEQVTIVGGLK